MQEVIDIPHSQGQVPLHIFGNNTEETSIEYNYIRIILKQDLLYFIIHSLPI